MYFEDRFDQINLGGEFGKKGFKHIQENMYSS